MTLGKSLDPVNQGFPSTNGMVASLYKGVLVDYHRTVPRRRFRLFSCSSRAGHGTDKLTEYFVDVQDIGRLHVAAAVLTKIRGQRIFGFAERYNWDAILDILRKLEPAKAFPENFSGGEDPNEIEPRHKAEQLLRDLGGPGWTPLEESIRNVVQGLREIEGGHIVQTG
jgi:hypothetical protein